MIDLAAAYEAVATMLAEEGFPEAVYLVELAVWNHRQGQATIFYNISAQPIGSAGCLGSYSTPTWQDGVEDLRRQIRRAVALALEAALPAIREDLRAVRVPEA